MVEEGAVSRRGMTTTTTTTTTTLVPSSSRANEGTKSTHINQTEKAWVHTATIPTTTTTTTTATTTTTTTIDCLIHYCLWLLLLGSGGGSSSGSVPFVHGILQTTLLMAGDVAGGALV